MTTQGGRNRRFIIIGIVLTTIGVVLFFLFLWSFSYCQSMADAGYGEETCIFGALGYAGLMITFLGFGVLFLLLGFKTNYFLS